MCMRSEIIIFHDTIEKNIQQKWEAQIGKLSEKAKAWQQGDGGGLTCWCLAPGLF